jgi:protein-disulfide isomerase
MKKLYYTLPILALAVLVASVAIGPASVTAQEEMEMGNDRADQILANLKLAFPQLENANVTMGEITPSGFDGLDQGSFVVNGRQTQNFLVSTDNTKLFLVAGNPIDVSRTADEITAEVAKREEQEAQAAAEKQARLAEAIEGRPMRGNPEAPVTIVEFSDFQCPYCARGANTVEQILDKYPGQVKFVFKHFPLGFHPWAKPASIAAYCAGEQDPDAFWTLHDKYFANQKALNPDNVIEKSKEYLAGSGIDMGQWAECAGNEESEAHKAATATVEADMAFGQELGVSGTPGFFVNGHFLNGAQPLAAFEPYITAVTGDTSG